MKPGIEYEIILKTGGGPFGSPVEKIIFARNQSKIRFECFVIATDWKVEETVEAHRTGQNDVDKLSPESEEFKVGGGGHDFDSVLRIESILASFHVEEFDHKEVPVVDLDGPTFEICLNLRHYKIVASWGDECPEEMGALDELVSLLREWGEPVFSSSEWR